ncbi:MAG: DUF4168 domain-containing protein [Microcoleaceae cyanobacterium]
MRTDSNSIVIHRRPSDESAPLCSGSALRRSVRRQTLRFLLASVISTTSLWFGFYDNLSIGNVQVEWGLLPAYAQSRANFTDEEIANFTRAALALEARRHQVFNEIKKIVGSVPRIACNQNGSIEALPRGTAQQLATSYCEEAEKIVKARGLTINRFNEIRDSLQTNPRLQQRFEAEIRRLQQSSGS